MAGLTATRRPCPGSADGHPCPKRRHLTVRSQDGRCSDCRTPGPSPARPDEVLVVDLDREVADAALERIRPLCRKELRTAIAPEMLEQLMLSCYQQGLVDGDQLAKRGLATC